MQNRFKLFIAALGIAVLSGCASVPMDTPAADAALKTFSAPPADQAGLYIYRDNFAGQSLKKTVKIDGEVIGETANRTYFYRLISPNPSSATTPSPCRPLPDRTTTYVSRSKWACLLAVPSWKSCRKPSPRRICRSVN